MDFRERYAQCRRYADTGEVTWRGGPVARFETRFDRERDSFWFRLWYTGEEWPQGTIAIDAVGARVDVTFPFTKSSAHHEPNTLELAIVSFMGISFGAAIVIPQLLLPEVIHANPSRESGYRFGATTKLIVRFLEPGLDTEITYRPKLED